MQRSIKTRCRKRPKGAVARRTRLCDLTLLASRGGRRRGSPLGKSAAIDPISDVLPVMAPRPSTNRELVVRSPRTPYVHVRIARPLVGQSRAPSASDLARPTRSHVGPRRRGPSASDQPAHARWF
jgi:hypothetical protein